MLYCGIFNNQLEKIEAAKLFVSNMLNYYNVMVGRINYNVNTLYDLLGCFRSQLKLLYKTIYIKMSQHN